MNKESTIIAIDPGKSGGIAVFANQRITAVKMPSNVKDLQLYLKMIIETYDDPIVFIEKVQAYRGNEDDAPGKKFGINKMLANYTELLTVIKLLEIPFIEVYPISWQSTLGLRIPKEKITKTERKNRYKQFSQKCFPELGKITLATSDALCLVQFAFNKRLHDPSWINEKIQNNESQSLF